MTLKELRTSVNISGLFQLWMSIQDGVGHYPLHSYKKLYNVGDLDSFSKYDDYIITEIDSENHCGSKHWINIYLSPNKGK